MADSVTVRPAAGPPGAKRNLAILGDGFTAADQAAYTPWVDTTVMAGVFAHDYFFEEFTVRVPADQLTRETLGSVAVTLHRVKAAAPSRPLTERSLGDQYLEEMRPVVGLVGLPEWVLPSALAKAGKRTAQG